MTQEQSEQSLTVAVYPVGQLAGGDRTVGSLAELVMSVVEPDTWDVVGSPAGSPRRSKPMSSHEVEKAARHQNSASRHILHADCRSSPDRNTRPGSLTLTARFYGNMVSHMKTTIELPDDLFIAAKKRAAELREPLRALVERGLRAELGRSKGRSAAKPRPVRWVTVAGGLPAGLDVADRAAMHEWLQRQR
jgi:hypothetical protein